MQWIGIAGGCKKNICCAHCIQYISYNGEEINDIRCPGVGCVCGLLGGTAPVRGAPSFTRGCAQIAILRNHKVILLDYYCYCLEDWEEKRPCRGTRERVKYVKLLKTLNTPKRYIF